MIIRIHTLTFYWHIYRLWSWCTTTSLVVLDVRMRRTGANNRQDCSTVYNRVTLLAWEIADSDVSGSAGEQEILVKTTTGRPSLFCRALSLIPRTTCTSVRRRQRSDILLSSPPFVCGNRDGEHRARQGSRRFQYLYIFFFYSNTYIYMDDLEELCKHVTLILSPV